MAAETPVITKKQEKTTLSGKKKKKPEVIKNVLAQPYQNYWPKLSLEDNNHFTEILTKFLPLIQPSKPKVLYDQIKDISKEDRKNFRRTFCEDSRTDIDKLEAINVVFGINDSAKLIENLEAAAVLVSGDVQPRLLVQHVVDQAVLHNVPVLVVSDLKSVCKKRCGICGAVMSLKKTVLPDSKLGVILQTICNIAHNYQKPKSHINFNRSLNESIITINDSDASSFIETVDEENVMTKNYHLKKPDDGTRAFVPESATQEETLDFINLDDTQVDSEPPAKKMRNNGKESYCPLKVKRLKGNQNRIRRKIKQLQKKKT